MSGIKREEMGRKGNLLSPPPPPSFILFCCRSNFRAITRSETLTTPANKAQDLMTSNDNSLMIHQEPFVMSSWIYFVTIQIPPFVVKRKMHRSCKLLLHEIPLQWLTWLDCDSEFSSVNGWHDTSTCAPLILCVLSVTFPASAKRKIPLLPISWL